MSIPQMTFFCVVVQHELCHMWFGNLVTMQWWNDLWLNEAFATYIAYYMMEKISSIPELDRNYPSIWENFLTVKYWGISSEQSATTHPI